MNKIYQLWMVILGLSIMFVLLFGLCEGFTFEYPPLLLVGIANFLALLAAYAACFGLLYLSRGIPGI